MNLLLAEDIIEKSAQQAGDAIIGLFMQVFYIVLIMALIGIGFMFIKYLIKKKIKELKEEKKKENGEN